MATEIKRHPLAIAWDEWLESDEGRKCAEGTARHSYLENRLHRAFMAGAASGEQAGADAARRECAGIVRELGNCYTASKCAADERERFVELKGQAEMAFHVEQLINERVGRPVKNDQGG